MDRYKGLVKSLSKTTQGTVHNVFFNCCELAKGFARVRKKNIEVVNFYRT